MIERLDNDQSPTKWIVIFFCCMVSMMFADLHLLATLNTELLVEGYCSVRCSDIGTIFCLVFEKDSRQRRSYFCYEDDNSSSLCWLGRTSQRSSNKYTNVELLPVRSWPRTHTLAKASIMSRRTHSHFRLADRITCGSCSCRCWVVVAFLFDILLQLRLP